MKLKLSDEVSFRMIQIFQEAVLLGLDGGDLLREVRLVVDPDDDETLVLDPDYARKVRENQIELAKNAEKLIELEEKRLKGINVVD